MMKHIHRWFAGRHQHNNQYQSNQAKTQGKPVQLMLADKHEPFGTITIDKVKQALEEENFSQLQSLYYYMLRDLKIASTVLARRQPLLSLDYTIDSDNQAFVDWVTDNIDCNALITSVSFAVYYGISLIDVAYTVKDGKLLPSFQLISPRFLHADTSKKQLKTTAEHVYIKQGDTKRFIYNLDPDKYIFHKHAIDVGEITDFSLASKLTWYFSLKHLALAHNVQYFDCVATPPLIAKTEGDTEKVIDTLFDMRSASVGVFNKDDVVEYLQITNKADFIGFIEYIDKQIATLVLGNTLSTGEGQKGSYSQSKIHENRQREILQFDARLIAGTITKYFQRLEKLNFSNPKGVLFSFDLKRKKDLKELSEVIKNLSDSGFEFDKEDIQKHFGIKIAGMKSLTNNNKSNNSIDGCNTSTNNTSDITKAHDIIDTKIPPTRMLEEALLQHIQAILATANSFDDAYTQLLDAYPTFAIDELDSAFFTAIANSTLLADAEGAQ